MINLTTSNTYLLSSPCGETTTPTKPSFPSYMLLCEFGAYAVFSEEAFESCHNLQKKEHSNVSSMKDNGQRLDVFCRRLQLHINAKFEEAYIQLKQRVTGKKRGKYAPSKK